MNKTMKKKGMQIFSSILLAVVILMGSHEISQRYYFVPLEAEAATRRTKLEALKRDNDESEQIKVNQEQMELAFRDAERQYDSLKTLLPQEAELPRVFDWIATRALERGLKLEHFSQNSKREESGTIIEIPLQVEVLGNYDGIERFIEDFSRFERMLRVRGVRMGQEQQQTEVFTVRANINFSAYVGKEANNGSIR
jgi:Tfp pilus assembly protein PilO